MINNILDFWFADTTAIAGERNSLWYGFNPQVDRHIQQHYGSLVTQALTGELDQWTATPDGSVALILLLDQFTRHIHRGSAQAFSGDDKALAVAEDGVSKGQDKTLPVDQRCFFYMPYEHSEQLAIQERGVALFEAMRNEMKGITQNEKELMASSLRYARFHRDIIKQFGRFPHRNSLMARTSTNEEQKYLDDGGTRFGQ